MTTSIPARVAHTVTLRKVRRIPLDPHFIPVCATCGDLSDRAIDIEDARILSKRHAGQVAAGAVSAG